MADPLQKFLQDPQPEDGNDAVSNEEIVASIEADNEKDYLKQLKKKNKKYLIGGLTVLERERIAAHICDLYKHNAPKHKELCDKIDEWDEVYRMERREIPGSNGDMPNYRTPLSTVTLEVVHANLMNVFFTPTDLMNVLPVEENDVPKVKKLSTFGNWSMKNELDAFHKIDRLFHNSSKIGECPYMVHWVKEYGTEIKREIIRNPADPTQPLFDPDTQEPLFQEVEEQKLLYNGPRLEVFSRKDYIQPESAAMGKTPPWEMRKLRMSYDEYLREELQGKHYPGSIQDIKGWGSADYDNSKIDYEGDTIPTDKWEQEFIEFYGYLKVNAIKNDDDDEETIEMEELADEFIALVHVDSGVLCSLRKNKFPLKMRPIDVDYFIPDDEGRRVGIGIMEFMDSLQKSYDVMYNQFIFGTTQTNNPVGFFPPVGNMKDDPIKIRNGFLYPLGSDIKFLQIPPPHESLQNMMEIVRSWAQLLFGISDYSAGTESKIDPSAPARKAEIVVQQGNVRLNTIIKRKNSTLKNIFKRWYLLYKENMPPNKFMRIAGNAKDNPWKFEGVTLSDFALKSIPDFEVVGNILNTNKQLEANKAIAIYNILLTNPFFNPQMPQGLQALHSLTRWLLTKLDEIGLDKFLPEVPGDIVTTPEEENARFLQGDMGEPLPQENHMQHVSVHKQMLVDPNIPEPIKQNILAHINQHVQMMQQAIQQQQIMGGMGINPTMAAAQPGGQTGQPQTGVPQNVGRTTERPVTGTSQGTRAMGSVPVGGMG